MIHDSSEGGYIALMSAIIVASVLTIAVFSMSYKSFTTRFNLLVVEYKKRSLNLAEACIHIAILKIIEDNSYAGSETIVFGDDECRIINITGTYTIHAQAYAPKIGFRRAVSNIEVVLNPDLSTADWKEVPNF